jgi:hypothetical protein
VSCQAYRSRIADAHLLYLFAARRGHAPAALVLAGIYDSVRFDKDWSLLGRADPVQALKWYRVAAAQSDGEAQARLRSLESWVDAKARAGDAEAERLRLSWRCAGCRRCPGDDRRSPRAPSYCRPSPAGKCGPCQTRSRS